MAEQTLREALEKNVSEDLEPPSGEVVGADKSNEPPPSGESPADEPPKPGVQVPETPIGEPPKQPLDPEKKEPAQADGRPVAPSLRAPQSWRPDVREHWAKVPLEVQQEVVRREQQVNRALSEASKYVQHHNEFQALCAPYANMIAMDGGNPLNTFKEYLQTAALLRLGAPQEKANAVANAVMQYGIDIQALDNALAQRVGQQQPGQQQPQQQQQFRDPRLDQLLNQMETRRQQNDEALTRTQQAEIDAFTADPKHEFFEDVRPMVADILEIYANQGIKCSLQEAYDKACSLHPEVSKIVTARNTAAAANSLVRRNNATIEAKRRAASLPPGMPNIAPGDNSELSLRDTLSAAIDQVGSRA